MIKIDDSNLKCYNDSNKHDAMPIIQEAAMAQTMKPYGLLRKVPDMTVEECEKFCEDFERGAIARTSEFNRAASRLISSDDSIRPV